MEEDADTTADVNFGKVLAISILAEREAWVVSFSAYSRRRSLSKSLSRDRDDDKRAFLWLSEREDGRSPAKCSLRQIRRKAKIEEDKFILSTRELPRNLLIPSNRAGSTGSKFVLLISFDKPSSNQLENDWVACRPCKALSIFSNSSMGIVMVDFDALGFGANFLKSSLSGAEDEK